MMQTFWIKIFVSLSALVLITVRFIWPSVKIDAITLGLLLVSVLPWLTSIIQSAKFPGGWEITFRDVQAAGDKITEGVSTSTTGVSDGTTGASDNSTLQPSYLEIFNQDPNLALVGLRIEIESRLRALAEKHKVKEQRSLTRLSRELIRRGVLDDASLSGLQELIYAGNQAAHGARVEDRVASWAFDYGPRILAVLDSKLVD